MSSSRRWRWRGVCKGVRVARWLEKKTDSDEHLFMRGSPQGGFGGRAGEGRGSAINCDIILGRPLELRRLRPDVWGGRCSWVFFLLVLVVLLLAVLLLKEIFRCIKGGNASGPLIGLSSEKNK